MRFTIVTDQVLVARPGVEFSAKQGGDEYREFVLHHLRRLETLQQSAPGETILVLAELNELKTPDNSFIMGYARVVPIEGGKVALVFYDERVSFISKIHECYIPSLFEALSEYPSFLMNFLPADPKRKGFRLTCTHIHPFAVYRQYSFRDLIADGVPHLTLADGRIVAFPYEVKNPSFNLH